MVTSQLNVDITKRTDAARKSTKRAENKLQQEFTKAGGLEDERRYQLCQLKREQALLRKELQTLKFESRMSSRNLLQESGLWSRSTDDFRSLRSRKDSQRRISSDYGKNFFGYISEPGTKKLIKKPTRQIERSIDAYCKKIDELIHQELIDQKLSEQKKENQQVEEKLKSWKIDNPVLLKRPSYKPRKENKFRSNSEVGKNVNLESETTLSMKSTASLRNLRSAVESLPPIIDVEAGNYSRSGESVAVSNPGSAKTRQTPLSKEASKELIFDAEVYAPDGRIRMAHRMPEFQIAFAEARQTRHVRTKYKRDFEIPLSVHEIFQ